MVLLIGKGTFTFFIGFGVMLYLLFFLLKDGAYLVNLILIATLGGMEIYGINGFVIGPLIPLTSNSLASRA
ncbi:MAG: hypothetical protein QG613_1800 [Pseudomonadota bacterium]|nr:hypothetical protein [Pseudomonadota bacterium]